jgi:hypothetical protein
MGHVGQPHSYRVSILLSRDRLICRGDQKWSLPHIVTSNYAYFCEIYYLEVVSKQLMTERILQEGGDEVAGRDVVWFGDRFNAAKSGN